ncbi:hypothetical protein Tco_0559534 [Tanacetum coccineum]
MSKRVIPRQANMVNDNVDMIVMVFDIVAMISEVNLVKCKHVTRNTGKVLKNEEKADSYEGLRCNTYDSVTPYPFDYHVSLGFGSIAGSLDPVSPVIRLPIERRINSGTRRVVAKNTFEGNALYPWIPALEQSNNLGGARTMGEKESKALMLNDREKQAITEAKSNSIHGNI